MKRIIAILLMIAMAVSLAACGEDSSSETQKDVKVADRSGETETETAAQESQPSETSEAPEAVDAAEAADAAIEETVLLDEAGVKITAKSLTMDALWGPELKLLIENDSGKDLTVQSRNVSVNGYMVDPMLSADVVNGKKANDSLTFSNSDLAACGITSIAEIEFSFHIFTTEDWETYLDTDQIRLETSIAGTYAYPFDDSGDVVYDAEGIRLVVKGLAEDSSIFGPSVVVYIENNRADAFTVQARDVSVNGFMVDALFSCEVMPGKKAVDTITFMDSELEENEISAIEDLELSFHIFDNDSWDTIADTDAIHLSF